VHPEEVGTKGERGNNEDRRRERGGFRAGHAETAWVSIVPLKRRGRNTTTVIFIGVALVGKTTSDVIIPVCLHPPRRRNRKKDAFSALLFRIKEKITTPRVTTLQVLGVKVVRRCLIKKTERCISGELPHNRTRLQDVVDDAAAFNSFQLPFIPMNGFSFFNLASCRRDQTFKNNSSIFFPARMTK
jgi:hypothetical protein